MRRKRNLEERLSALKELILVKGRPMLNLKEAQENFRAVLNLADCFKNDNPVELDIGCGNGEFLYELSMRHPERNLIGVEVCSNVILTAVERCKDAGRENVRFLNIPAEILPCYLPEGSIERIYLNFSTPLPQKSRERQRLTAPRFLEIYRSLLVERGTIVQKTDSKEFFEYSLARFEENGFRVLKTVCDLHHSEEAKDNIVTEYERNFAKQGLPIFYAVVQREGQ